METIFVSLLLFSRFFSHELEENLHLDDSSPLNMAISLLYDTEQETDERIFRKQREMERTTSSLVDGIDDFPDGMAFNERIPFAIDRGIRWEEIEWTQMVLKDLPKNFTGNSIDQRTMMKNYKHFSIQSKWMRTHLSISNHLMHKDSTVDWQLKKIVEFNHLLNIPKYVQRFHRKTNSSSHCDWSIQLNDEEMGRCSSSEDSIFSPSNHLIDSGWSKWTACFLSIKCTKTSLDVRLVARGPKERERICRPTCR